jgi:peptidoglycan/xylan/chitin deacetylase (PgdA/CDA1 family)
VSGYTHAAALLEEVGWHGHFLVTTGFVGSRSFMSKEQIRSLRRRGHVIGSHSVSHPARMSACRHDELVREWRNSRETLADILGEDVTVASVPGGYYSKRVARAAAEAGVRVLFTSEPVTQCRTIDECLIVGRFCLRRGDSPRTAARMAAGDRPQRIRSWLAWNARKLAKTMGGDLYIRARLSALR